MASGNLGFIHVFEPAKGAKNPPTLLLLHGTGADEHDLIPLGRALAPHANILSPRGKESENGMARFFKRTGPNVFDEKNIIFRIGELADFIRAATKSYGFDPKKVFAAGFSNGANTAAVMLLLHPRILAGAICLRPLLPLKPEKKPDLKGVPVFIAIGTNDQMIPPWRGEELASYLSGAGADVTVHREQAGHELRDGDIKQAKLWLEAKS